MTASVANTSAITMCDAAVDACESGSGDAQATLAIYSGTIPALVDTALSGNTLLAELEMSNPAFGGAVDDTPGAIATAAAISDDTAANATGIASFFRIFNLSNVAVLQGAVTVTAGGGELELNSINLQEFATVEVTALTFTMPEG